MDTCNCSVCRHEIQSGYRFCHSCGTPAGGVPSGAIAEGPPGTSFADLVDKARGLSSQTKDLADSAQRQLDLYLGSPVSLQRQIAYALVCGFALACVDPTQRSPYGWLQAWLATSVLALLPIRYWTTGVAPFSGLGNRILGPEFSLRRRLILSLLVLLLGASPVTLLAAIEGRPLQSSGLRTIGYFLGNYLVTFYLMGFVASWRAVSGCESSIGREGMASKAGVIAEQISSSMEQRKIPNLEHTRVEMAKLHRYTAGESSGRVGEQLIFTRGKTRVVVFVQSFGNDLLIRWSGFLDASGRRLWLLYGYLLSSIDRFFLRWTGTGLVQGWRQTTEALSLASRNQILLRSGTGGVITRTLRLTEGFSEYTWNDLHGLDEAIRESVVTALQEAVADHEEAKEIRAQVHRHSFAELRSGAAAGVLKR